MKRSIVKQLDITKTRQGKQRFINQEGGFVSNAQLAYLLVTLVAVGGLISFGIYMYDRKGNEATSLTTSIVSAVSGVYKNNPGGFANISTQDVIDLITLPKNDVLTGGTSIKTPWYGSNSDSIVTVNPGSNEDQFTITFADVPEHGCAQLAGWGTKQYGMQVSVNGTAVTDEADVATNCTTAPASVLITVE